MKVHTDALVALIKTIPAFATKTWPVSIPEGTTPTLPYVLVWPSDGDDSTDRLTGPSVTQHPRWSVWVVGSSYSQVGAGAKLIKDKLIVNGRGTNLTVPGESCGPFWYDSPLTIQTIKNVTPALVYHIGECGFDADPA